MAEKQCFTCIGASHGAPVTPANREDWIAARSQSWLPDLVKRIQHAETDEELKRLKAKLPVWTPRCAAFRDNHRKESEALQPLNRLMLDIDEKGHTDEILTKCRHFGDQLYLDCDNCTTLRVLMIEDSVRLGTHILVEMPQGMAPNDIQELASKKLGLKCDPAVKNIAGCIYQVPMSYTRFMDDAMFTTPLCHSECSEAERRIPSEASETRNNTSFNSGQGPQDPSGAAHPLDDNRNEDKGIEDANRNEENDSTEQTTPRPERKGSGEGPQGEAPSVDCSPLSVVQPKADKLPYGKIIPAFFLMETDEFPNVPEGMRNETVFAVCAKYLRYCTDHNEDKMVELIYPQYSFGLGKEEIQQIVHSAAQRERSLTPRVVKEVLKQYSGKPEVKTAMYAEANEPEEQVKPYPSLEECILTEMDLPKLPPILETALKIAPPGYKFVILCGLVPALMTLLTDVKGKYGSKSPVRLNGWTHLDGPPASNKSLMIKPIEAMLSALIKQDEAMQLEEDKYNSIPHEDENGKTSSDYKYWPIRIMPPNTTRLAHLMRLKAGKGKHTYTYCEELKSLKLRGGDYTGREDFMMLLFDNGVAGNQSLQKGSMKGRVPVCWNISTSSTRDVTLNTFRNVTDGAVTRVMICLMPDNRRSRKPAYREYSDADKEFLETVGERLMQMNGLVLTPKLDRALDNWLERMRELGVQMDDDEWLTFKNRSADIAHTFGVVMHLMGIMQQVLDAEKDGQTSIDVKSLDLNSYPERQWVIDMALHCADYCLNTQYMLWARKMKKQLGIAYSDMGGTPKNAERLYVLPEKFTYDDLTEIFPKLSRAGLRKMVERMVASGAVIQESRDKIATFKKLVL